MATRSGPETVEDTSTTARRSAVSSAETDPSRWRRVGATVVAGGLLALVLRRRSLGAAAVATVGGWLSYRLLGDGGSPERASGGDTSRDGRTADATGTGGTVDTETSGDAVTASGSITIGHSPEELSGALRDADRLDRVVGPVAEVTEVEGNRHRYTVDGPLDLGRSWEMRLTDDRPGEFVRWASDDGSAIVDEWRVHLGPSSGDRGTMVRLEVDADPPGGAVGRAVLDRLAPVSDGLARTALDRFKGLVETGEVATIGGDPSGRGEGDLV